MNPQFLTLDEVIDLHREQIELYGGILGVRDTGLLESALATPKVTFGGHYLHGSLSEVAAAYLFHLVQNHPFLDGNKRIGLVAALTFLGMNDVHVRSEKAQLIRLVLQVADGKQTKAEVAGFLKKHAEPW